VGATAFVDAAIQQRMAGQNTQMVGRARMRVIGYSKQRARLT